MVEQNFSAGHSHCPWLEMLLDDIELQDKQMLFICGC